ncbi:MAG: HAMP domain-containing protein [Candidatus Riflebacteria bacterium]|nr:HAMP domain-containing protein [Candidatus Riflebacteria bacterium]
MKSNYFAFFVGIAFFVIPFSIIVLTLKRIENVELQKSHQECADRLEQEVEEISQTFSVTQQISLLLVRLSQTIDGEIKDISQKYSDPESAKEYLSGKIQDTLDSSAFSIFRGFRYELLVIEGVPSKNSNKSTKVDEPKKTDQKSKITSPSLDGVNISEHGEKLGFAEIAPKVAFIDGESEESRKLELLFYEKTRTLLGFPVTAGQAEFSASQRIFFVPGESGKPRRGIYWYSFSSKFFGNNLILAILLENADFSKEFAKKLMAKNWGQKDTGIAFLPRNKFHCEISSPLWKAISPWKGNYPFAAGQPPKYIENPDFLIRIERLWDEKGFDVALIRPIIPAVDLLTKGARYCTLSFLVFLFISFVIEAFVFGRGPRFSFSKRLIITFVLAGFFPISGDYFIAKEVFRQTRKGAETEERSALSRTLTRVDKNFWGNYFKSMFLHKKILTNPTVKRGLIASEKSYRKNQDLKNTEALFSKIWKNFSDESGHPQKLPDGSQFRLNAVFGLYLVGPDRFSFARARDPEAKVGSFRKLMETMSIYWLNNRNNKTKVIDVKPTSGGALKNEVVKDYALELLFSFLRGDPFFEFFFHEDRIFEFSMGFYQTIFCPIGVKIANEIRFLFLLIWGGTRFEYPYLMEEFQSFLIKFPESMFFAIDKHSRWCYPKYLSKFTDIQNSGLRSLESGISISEQSSDYLIEVHPGKTLRRFVFIGASPKEPLNNRVFYREVLFWCGILLVLLMAIILSVLASNFFLNPISALTKAVKKVGKGDFEASIPPSGPAEFHSVANIFNFMCRELKDGEILGRFVSEAVRKAARDGNLEMLAGEAKEIAITVVFCGLSGLAGDGEKMDPGKLVSLLDEHLFNVNHFSSLNGGEIDKMIGEKIMVVFDHSRFPSAELAVESAIKMALGIIVENRLKSPETTVRPVFGINSGTALSGILGSPAHRLDYTVIGDTVNISARLTEIAVREGHSLLISGTSLNQMKNKPSVFKLPISTVRGKTREVEVFSISC